MSAAIQQGQSDRYTVEPGEEYHCLSNGRTYVVLALGRMKHPDSGDWLQSVTYRSAALDSDEIYTRALSSFEDSFVPMPR